MSGEPSALPFTGERFLPEVRGAIFYEHWHRYAAVSPLVAGKRVLDAACGEGYGSALLAGVAAEVVGVDVDEATIGHARARYGAQPNLRYEQADATALPFADRSFDVIVSFETLEHLAAQEQLLAGFARVLADDGVLIISSPDKRTYSEVAGFRNEFHVRELYREELLALLKPHFPQIRLYGQKLLFQSVLWALDDASNRSQAWTADAQGAVAPGLVYDPVYYLAVCTRTGLPPDLPEYSLFGDRREAVYEHYNHEIRKNMSAGARIAELEAEVARLKRQVEERRSPQATAPRRAWPWWRGKRPNE